MYLFRLEIKAVAFFKLVAFVSYKKPYFSFKHKAEFLALVRVVRVGGAARFYFDENRLHLVDYAVVYEPMRDVTVVLLYEIVVCPVNGALFGLAFGKQLDKRRAERRHYVLESGYGRAGDVVFKLRDISLCQLATVA